VADSIARDRHRQRIDQEGCGARRESRADPPTPSKPGLSPRPPADVILRPATPEPEQQKQPEGRRIDRRSPDPRRRSAAARLCVRHASPQKNFDTQRERRLQPLVVGSGAGEAGLKRERRGYDRPADRRPCNSVSHGDAEARRGAAARTLVMNRANPDPSRFRAVFSRTGVVQRAREVAPCTPAAPRRGRCGSQDHHPSSRPIA
jgi:hypothetical protein